MTAMVSAQMSAVTTMAIAAAAITPVDIQPTSFSPSCTGNLPMILALAVEGVVASRTV